MRSYLSRKAGVVVPLLTLLAILALQPNSFSQTSTVAADYGKLPLSFEANQGQSDPQVKFLSRGNGYSLFLTDSGAVLSLTKGNRPHARATSPTKEYQRDLGRPRVSDLKTDVVRMELVGAAQLTPVSGTDKLPGTANYFIGNDPRKWHAGVPTYARVRYGQVYPGVDLVYYGNQRQLEYDFVVAPQADAKTIRMHFAGAEKLKLSANGDLAVIAKNGEIAFHKPVVYQTMNGIRQDVAGRFAVATDNTVGFEVANYDRTAPLVIDPVLVYSTYLGGSIGEAVQAIAVDASGAAYVTGLSESPDFPVTSGALQSNNDKSGDGYTAFVAKLNAAGTALVYATYLGGSTAEFANAIAVDGGGNAYVAGKTESTDFPTTTGAFQPSNPDGGDTYTAFVSKLNPSGSALVYSTYLGGSNPLGADPAEIANGLVIDSHGDAYVAGFTASSDFPVTPGAFQTSTTNFDGAGFVAVLNPAGSGLVYSTFLGSSGAGGSQATTIAIDSAGDAYAAGFTGNPSFPVTSGAYQKTAPSGAAFLTKLNPAGTAALYSTFLGGKTTPYIDQINAVAVGSSGIAYVAGLTYSTKFPVTSGALQTSDQGGTYGTGFVTSFNSTGSSLVYSTYLGGNYTTTPYSIQVDSLGDAYVAGNTDSQDFPVTPGAYQITNPTNSSIGTGFIAKLNPTGTALLYATYFGGGTDSANGLTLDSSGNTYVGGSTASTKFPVTTGAFQTTNHSTYGGTGFVSKLDFTSTPTKIATQATLTSTPNPQEVGGNVTFTGKVTPETGSGTPTGSVTTTIDGKTGPTLTLSDGTATFSSDSLTVGSHTIMATYGGDVNYYGSTATLTQTVTALTAATPVFSPVAGTYAAAQSVTITDATSGAVIYYTTNGSTPTASSTKYTGAIAVSATETIKAIAVAAGYANSAVASATYTIEKAAATPVFSPVAGTYAAAQSVTITDATSGAVIYYTTNGSTPTASSTKYTGAIAVSATETIKAIAVAAGYANSAVASATYTIEKAAATPVFSPVAGTYAAAQSVTITDATSGAVIYFTTNGSTPTASSTKYTGAIAVSATETIKAIAVAAGYANSAVASATYTIEKAAATPVFSPVAGTYAAAQTVTITDATSGAVIYYTTNGSTPTTASTKYTAPISVSATETIKAIAVATGYTNSAVASATYTIEKPAATPAFSPAAGTYAAAQSVTLTDATSGATIYYTTNGATPTTASTKYTTAIAVSATETIKATAVATGYANSAVASATYTIK